MDLLNTVYFQIMTSMKLQLRENGNPRSALISALEGRRLDLMAGRPGAHPVQSISARWRVFSASLSVLVTELESFRIAVKPDGQKAIDDFRRLTYDATEIFDAYTQLLVDRLEALGSKTDLRQFKTSSKRLRAPWATICNKFKHSNAQIAFVWAVSKSAGLTSPRFMILSYRDGKALIRDDEVHKGQRSGVCIVKASQELLHALLRVDLQAAKLVGEVADQSCSPMPAYSGEIPIGNVLRHLVALEATALPDESTPFDGLAIDEQNVHLVRLMAKRLADPVEATTTLTADGITRTFSFA